MAMHQSAADEFEALDRLRLAVAQLGFARTVRGLAEIAHEEAERLLQTGDRHKVAAYADTFQPRVIAALPDQG
jgi:hypothetical protein